MMNRRQGHRFKVAHLIVFLTLEILLAMCFPASFSSRLASSTIACVDSWHDPPDLNLLQEQ